MKLNKRKISTLIPYKWTGNTVYFYLQRRDQHAPTSPNGWGLFGGGLEKKESPLAAMLRETKEELNFIPHDYFFFNRYEFLSSINNVFGIEVSKSFEHQVEVREGRYGRFLSKKKIQELQNFSDSDKLIITQLSKKLKNQPTH